MLFNKSIQASCDYLFGLLYDITTVGQINMTKAAAFIMLL